MRIIVTGAAGFIGMHVCRQLLDEGDFVIGIDNLNDYYSPELKIARLGQINRYDNFEFYKEDISNYKALNEIFSKYKPDMVVNLAAQAGVRHSIEKPSVYIQSNLVGFANILELCRQYNVKHLLYASSSSVYGLNSKIPFSEGDRVDQPASLYAATKKSNELMAFAYSHLYGLPTTGLRYFTVYGPWGRPDMAPWLFTSAILDGRPINVFNDGKMKRDFTYIDDITSGTISVLKWTSNSNSQGLNIYSSDTGITPFKLFNIGNNSPVKLMHFIELLERILGRKAIKQYLPMQNGDVLNTYANIEAINDFVGFSPKMDLLEGLKKWSEWYTEYIK